MREIRCRWCGKIFCVCQSCWRGQAYCSRECRSAAKRKVHREAQRRYRRKEEGKKAHREAENLRRMGLRKKNKPIVDDPSSTAQCSSRTIAIKAKLSDEGQIGCSGSGSQRTGWCHFCGSFGVIVAEFPRRGYGKPNYRIRWQPFVQEEDENEK